MTCIVKFEFTRDPVLKITSQSTRVFILIILSLVAEKFLTMQVSVGTS